MSDMQIVAIIFIAGCIVYLVERHLRREHALEKMKYEMYLRSMKPSPRLRSADEDFINEITADL